jgi:hypothetical protein
MSNRWSDNGGLNNKSVVNQRMREPNRIVALQLCQRLQFCMSVVSRRRASFPAQ